MLDLKAKLLKAGLVSEDDVARAEKEEKDARDRRAARRNKGRGGKGGKGKGKGGKAKGPGGPPALSEAERWAKRLEQLAAAGRADQYEAVRGWVERTRLDPVGGLPGEDWERFHYPKGGKAHPEGEDAGGAIGWVTIPPDLAAELRDGKAGIIAFMSNNGLAHAVVPRDVAVDVHRLRPEWLRSLADFDFELLDENAHKRRKKREGDAAADGTKADEQAGDTPEATSAEGTSAEAGVNAEPAASADGAKEPPGDVEPAGPSAGDEAPHTADGEARAD